MTTAAAERNICCRCGRFLGEHERGVGDTAPYGIERSVPVGQRGVVGIAPRRRHEHLNSPEKTKKEGRFHRNCPSFHTICIYLRARISRATNTPLADAWESECVMPLPSPMTYSPSCGVSRWSFSATSML